MLILTHAVVLYKVTQTNMSKTNNWQLFKGAKLQGDGRSKINY